VDAGALIHRADHRRQERAEAVDHGALLDHQQLLVRRQQRRQRGLVVRLEVAAVHDRHRQSFRGERLGGLHVELGLERGHGAGLHEPTRVLRLDRERLREPQRRAEQIANRVVVLASREPHERIRVGDFRGDVTVIVTAIVVDIVGAARRRHGIGLASALVACGTAPAARHRAARGDQEHAELSSRTPHGPPLIPRSPSGWHPVRRRHDYGAV
jgi:hypothetical protein